nr:hypothetical protein [uncultured Undibacterium sp.]
MNYQQRVDRAQQLLPAYSFLTGAPIEDVATFADQLIGVPVIAPLEACGDSGLNADQSPLQLCITSTAKDIHCRFISDPCSYEAIPRQRYRQALQLLPQVLSSTSSSENASLVGKLLDHFVSQDSKDLESFTRGVFWLGASLEKQGVALYVDTSVNDIAVGWDVAHEFFVSQNLGSSAAIQAIQTIRDYCWLSSIGIEGSNPENSRIKMYARMNALMPNNMIGTLFPPVNALIQSGCLAAIMGDQGATYDDILFNFGFSASTGDFEDMKIDIASAPLGMDMHQLSEVSARVCDMLGLQSIPIDALSERYNLAPSFIGVAVSARGQKRLNVYLKCGTA